MIYMDSSKGYMMNTNYALGMTGNFLANMMLAHRCMPGYEIVDGCMDAPDYVPTGVHSDQNGVAVPNVTFAR
jgi:hypothetical protein